MRISDWSSDVCSSDLAALVSSLNINEPLLTAYYRSLERIASELGADRSELMKLALSMPEAMGGEDAQASDDEWKAVWNVLLEAVTHFARFLYDEGAVLDNNLRLRVSKIRKKLERMEQTKPKR